MAGVTTVPLHERIRADVERRILSGALQPGDRLPTEMELMREYACARMTVNKALSTLMQAGMIERRRRAGSFVSRPRLHAMVLDVPDLAEEVVRRGGRYAFRLIRRGERGPDERRAEEVALARGEMLLEVEGLHLADGDPLAVEHRLIALATVPGAREADFAVEAPGTWLLRTVPWTEAETRIAAVSADAATAQVLGIDTGAACLSIERRTWRGTETVTSVRQVFVGVAYDLTARFAH